MHLAGSSPQWPLAGHEAYGHSHLNITPIATITIGLHVG